MKVETRHEKRRGCGFRKPGGLYLVSDGPAAECCRLPLPLTVCPTCSAGIKPARGWTWVDVGGLFPYANPCTSDTVTSCPLAAPRKLGRAGLLWVGEKFYPTPADFNREAREMGVSRRIPALPMGFVPGETWVLLAHRKAVFISNPETEYAPGVFYIFRPERVEYVVRGDETPEQLQRLIDRGITPVKVIEDERQQGLPYAAAQ
ncbi:MAG: hypothetical protein QME75_04900 [Deltaproteobacteria bacterium]|nr:hypothetical protein [Deltaproteobacteria bacterium]